MKKVMILGANSGQMPFINICKARGYYTIVVSTYGNYPGFHVADKCYYIDTRNKEEILKVALEEKIDAITTDQTDVSVVSVAYVAEKMGLLGIGVSVAQRFTNKYEMRKAAQEAGIPVPQFEEVHNLEEALAAIRAIGYPAIIKPTDSSGSRGVFRVDCDDDVIHDFSDSISHSFVSSVIVEQFIEGKEYLADGFAMEYDYLTLDVGEKEFFDVPNLCISKMCMFSSAKIAVNDRIMNMVKETNDKLIRSFKLPFGITHAEYIYSYLYDKVYLVECAARGGGVFLSSDITPNASGFNTNEALIDYLVEGIVCKPSFDFLSEKVSGWLCFSFPEGEISDISGVEEVLTINGVDKVILDNVEVGKSVYPLKDDSGKYGPVLFTCFNREECYNVIERVRKTLSIKVQTRDGVKGVIW